MEHHHIGRSQFEATLMKMCLSDGLDEVELKTLLSALGQTNRGLFPLEIRDNVIVPQLVTNDYDILKRVWEFSYWLDVIHAADSGHIDLL